MHSNNISHEHAYIYKLDLTFQLKSLLIKADLEQLLLVSFWEEPQTAAHQESVTLPMKKVTKVIKLMTNEQTVHTKFHA